MCEINECPSCSGLLIAFEQAVARGGSALQRAGKCAACGCRWTDIFEHSERELVVDHPFKIGSAWWSTEAFDGARAGTPWVVAEAEEFDKAEGFDPSVQLLLKSIGNGWQTTISLADAPRLLAPVNDLRLLYFVHEGFEIRNPCRGVGVTERVHPSEYGFRMSSPNFKPRFILDMLPNYFGRWELTGVGLIDGRVWPKEDATLTRYDQYGRYMASAPIDELLLEDS